MSLITEASRLAEDLVEPNNPCAFESHGCHTHPDLRMFHDDGPTVLVDWLWGEAILCRGPRSWVCKTQAAISVSIGHARYVIA